MAIKSNAKLNEYESTKDYREQKLKGQKLEDSWVNAKMFECDGAPSGGSISSHLTQEMHISCLDYSQLYTFAFLFLVFQTRLPQESMWTVLK